MLRKKISIFILAALVTNLSSTPLSAFAESLTTKNILQEDVNKSEEAQVTKVDLANSQYKDEYNDEFKIDNKNIESISNNGGKYYSSIIDKAIDGDLNTHWETGKQNTNEFTNEVVFEFTEETTIDKILYLARRDAGGKGFAKEFEIYSSLTDNEDDFTLVSSGSYDGSTLDTIEIKFNPTKFKRLKFKFKNAYNNWASAAEFMFYKEDSVLDKVNNLFTDNTMSKVSEEFNSIEKVNELEEEFKSHVLYNEYTENFENARIILTQEEIVATEAKVSKFDTYYSEDIQAYDETFKMNNSNIESITSIGGNLRESVGTQYIIDGKLDTYWETGKHTSDSFKNELIFTLKETTVLNRIAYRSAWNTVGFAENFEIWASNTTKGDTFQLVTSATTRKTADVVEIKFNPTSFKRIKFVFKNNGTATASEMMFYKEDTIKDKIDRLFTNEQKNEVSEEFNTIEKLNKFEEEAKFHPLYNTMKEEIENAKILLENNSVDYVDAKVSNFLSYNDEKLSEYDEMFKIKRENITSITTNGGQYAHNSIDRAIDGDVNTQWHSGKTNNNDFTNEIVITLDKLTTIDRITYLNKVSRGFAKAFDIYASRTTTGDTFEKISYGQANITTNNIEIKFNPTELRRIKFVFKEGYENWALAYEIGLYKEDKVRDSVGRLFTTSGMDVVNEEFNSLEKITALENEAKSHPLYELFEEDIKEAKEVVSGQIQNIKTVVAEQQGDRVAHANQNLKIGLGNNNQPTGVVALPGETITVYVDVEEGKPVPSLAFSQQEGSWLNWVKTVQLKPGKNEIVVPKITQEDGWYQHSVTPGGPVYIVNPYTEEEQGKAPVIRFAKGVQTFPMFDKNTNEEEFINFLKEYKAKLDEDAKNNPDVMDRKVIDTFELVADHVVITGTASGAYTAYVEQGFKPTQSIKQYNDHMDMLFKYQGIDGRSEKHDIKYTRENIRLAQPYAAMYAASNHIGVQRNLMVSILTDVGGWGIDHEIGHRMDIGARTIGEVTNNMLPQNSAYYYDKPNKRIPFESHIYKNVIDTDNNVYIEGGHFERLGVFWQLEMLYPGYWAKLNSLYRENNITVVDLDDKLDKLAYYSSMALELDLTEHFERHGFPVTDETKEFASKYKKPENKIWYASYDYIEYEGEGFTDNNIDLEVKTAKEGENIKVSFNVDEEYRDDVLGYEVYRNGELVAFTSTNSFIDTEVNYTDNVVYKVVVFDKKLNEGQTVEVSSYKPTIKVSQNEITLKLREEFNPMDLVQSYNYKGEDITDSVKVNSNLDINKKGNYEIKYTVTDENITTEQIVKVNVVSDYEYLSDYQWESIEYGYGTPRRNSNIKGRVNGDIQTFEKGFAVHANGKIVYDLSDKDYDTFEVSLGVDMNIPAQNNSSIEFKIIGDDKVLVTTGVLKHSDNMVYIKVPVEGVKKLTIEIDDAGDGKSSDHAIIVNPKLTTNNVKPVLEVGADTYVELRSEYNLMDSVIASDVEDGNLTSSIVVNKNGFTTDKAGEYTVEYSVTDNDGNTTTKERKILVYSKSEYMSDMEWESAVSGWKSVKKDSAVNTNNKIKLNIDGTVTEFDKGIGAATNAEIVYNLNGDYNVFTTYLGTDKNYNVNATTIIFKIFADGEEVYTSDVIRANSKAEFVKLDVTGVKELKLVANDAGDSGYGDFASWADAKVYSTNSKPELVIPDSISTTLGNPIDINQEYSAIDIEDGNLTSNVKVEGEVNFDKTGKYPITYTVSDSDGNTVTKTRTIAVVDMNDFTYLSDLDWKSETHTYTTPLKNTAINGSAISLTDENGSAKTFEKGIGSHSTTTIVYDLTGKDYAYFTSYIGVTRNMYNSIASIGFDVYVDGVLKYSSEVMTGKMQMQFVKVDINDAKELKLVVNDGGNNIGSDHGAWADAKLHYANENGASINRTELNELIKSINELDSKVYTEESFNNLTSVLENVNTNLADGYTQEEIDTMYNNLKQAYDALVKATDFSVLEEVIATNSNLNELHYYKDALTAHKALVEEAKKVLANENATQEEIDTILDRLNESAKNLVVRENKVELEKKIKEAKEIKNNNYQKVRWDNFLWAIDYASEIYNNIDATDEEIRSAVFTLEYMKDELK